MNRPPLPEYRMSRKILGCAMGVSFALLTPVGLGLCAAVFPFPVLTAFLYAFGGIVPAAVSLLCNVAAFGFYYGWQAGLCFAIAFTLPSAIVIRGLSWRVPFGKQLRQALISQIVCIVLALACAYLLAGGQLIEVLLGKLRELTEPFAGGVDYVLGQLYGIEGMPSAPSVEQLADGLLSQEQRAYYLDVLFSDLESALALYSPGYLLGASVITSVLAVAWPSRIIHRKMKEDEHPAYVPLARWFLPWNVSLGLLLMLLVSCVLYALGVSGCDIVCLTLQLILMAAFRVQAAAALERLFTQLHWKPWLRALIIALVMVLAGQYAFYYGAFSALFGSAGAFRQIRAQRANHKDDH